MSADVAQRVQGSVHIKDANLTPVDRHNLALAGRQIGNWGNDMALAGSRIAGHRIAGHRITGSSSRLIVHSNTLLRIHKSLNLEISLRDNLFSPGSCIIKEEKPWFSPEEDFS